MSNIVKITTYIRFGVFMSLGSLYFHKAIDVASKEPVLGYAVAGFFFSYSASILLAPIFKLNKELEDVRKDQGVATKDEQ